MKGYLCRQPLLRHVRRDEKQAANVHCVLKRMDVNWRGEGGARPTFLFVLVAAPFSEKLAVESSSSSVMKSDLALWRLYVNQPQSRRDQH